MKSKITLFVLLVALLGSVALQAQKMSLKNSTPKAIVENPTKNPNLFANRANGLVPQAVKVEGNVRMLGLPKAEGDVQVWDFEDADQFSGFILDDKDGDGFNWQYYNNTGLETGRMTAHEGEGLIASASYDNDSGTALFPDNWLISLEMPLGGALKFWAAGQDASYAAEVFGVYVSVNGGNSFTQIGTDKTATGDYVEYEFDLSAYAGQTGQFAIVHHNVTDMFFLNVDDITLDLTAEITPEPTIPTNVAVTPTATTGEVAWVEGDNNGSWNLRWRPYVDPALQNRFWDFPIPGYEDQLDGWGAYDADGDGYGWGLYYSSDAQDDACWGSASYISNYGAASPDNWLFTPEVPLGGTLKFDTWNYSVSYPDKIQVYVCDNPDFESLDEFVAVSEFIEPGTTAQSVEIDLSDFEGMGVIAFRHYDCTDQWTIYIDNIAVEIPGAVEPAEWTVVENATNPYTIEGLTPETEYEVQVMAYNEAGDKYTDWTESVNFTTLADEQPQEAIDEFYVVGTFNDWNQLEGGGRIEFDEVEEGVFEAKVDLPAGAEFKIITFDEEGNTVWFGGQDENNVGYYLITPELLDVATALIDGANFKMQDAAVYKIRITMADADNLKSVVGPLLINFSYYAPTAITNITTDKADNTWYNLQGQKLNGKPATAGIYINGGKKVVVK